MMSDQPSEWGKLNQGQAYMPFAMDVARAVFAVGLGEHQASLFWHLAEHCWAPARKGRIHSVYADPVGCTIKLAELAKLWAVPLPRLSAAKKWLVDANMIREIDGELRINKDADSWKVPGSDRPLLSPEKLAYAAGARTRSRKPDKHESVTVDRNLDLRSTVSPGSEVTVNRNLEGEKLRSTVTSDESRLRSTVSEVTVNRMHLLRSTVTSHIEERTREEDSKKEEEECGGAPTPAVFETSINDPIHVARIAALAEERWPVEDAEYFVGDLCRTIPVAIVEEVLNRAVDKWPKKKLDPPKRKWIRTTCDGLVAEGWKPKDHAATYHATSVDRSQRYLFATESQVHPSKRKPNP